MAARPNAARATSSGDAKLIVVVASGGWDTTYSIDPKPDSDAVDVPEGEVQVLGGIPIWASASRPSTAKFFQTHGDKTLLISGVQVRSVTHGQALRWLLTGTGDQHQSDFAAIFAAEHGLANAIPYLLLGDRAQPAALAGLTGRVGFSNQLVRLLDPAQAWPSTDPDHVPYQPSVHDEEAISTYLDRQVASLRAERAPSGVSATRLDDFATGRDHSSALRAYASAFGPPIDTGPVEAQVPLALDLLEAGVTSSIIMDGDTGQAFDTHYGNTDQAPAQERLFAALDDLVSGLEDRELLDRTLVVVASELGRTPKLNPVGGKDHWPYVTMFCLGNGILGGRVLGGTDDGLYGMPVDLSTGELTDSGTMLYSENILAAFLQLLDVDSEKWLPGAVPLGGLVG